MLVSKYRASLLYQNHVASFNDISTIYTSHVDSNHPRDDSSQLESRNDDTINNHSNGSNSSQSGHSSDSHMLDTSQAMVHVDLSSHASTTLSPHPQRPESRASRGFFFKKVGILVRRLSINLVRDQEGLFTRLGQMISFALLLWLFMGPFSLHQSGVQNRLGYIYEVVIAPAFMGMLNALALFPVARDVFDRERQDGLYSSGENSIRSFLSLSL